MPQQLDPKAVLLEPLETAVVPATTAPLLIRVFFKRNSIVKFATVWDDEGWVLDAIPVQDPLAWNGKHEIFCPVTETLRA